MSNEWSDPPKPIEQLARMYETDEESLRQAIESVDWMAERDPEKLIPIPGTGLFYALTAPVHGLGQFVVIYAVDEEGETFRRAVRPRHS